MPGTHPTVEQIPSSKDLDEPSPTDNESISSEEREDRKLALDTALGKAVTPPYCAQPGIKIPSDSTVFGVPLTEKSTNTMKEHKEKHYLMKSGMSETEALEKMKAQKVLLEKLAVACEARWAQIEKEEEDEEVELEKEHQIMVAEMDNCPIEWLPIIKLPTDEAPADKSQAEFVFVEEVPKENVPVDRSQTEFVDVEELVNKHVQPDNDNETIATLNISPLQLAKEDSDDAEQKPSGLSRAFRFFF
ncbi:hypothetical protein EJ08DRAFT_652160 [Tothia fuscella]|uniref:Uncharacterized protein n=1 Tax=Tothia fuscella TaxID=1048955 RepID=A0A9P4NK00_9PEZI|nr:hypothetical protein EJ08DRAFT_652160 [Tothia fuscella]